MRLSRVDWKRKHSLTDTTGFRPLALQLRPGKFETVKSQWGSMGNPQSEIKIAMFHAWARDSAMQFPV
jgi:hypothetical protein